MFEITIHWDFCRWNIRGFINELVNSLSWKSSFMHRLKEIFIEYMYSFCKIPQILILIFYTFVMQYISVPCNNLNITHCESNSHQSSLTWAVLRPFTIRSWTLGDQSRASIWQMSFQHQQCWFNISELKATVFPNKKRDGNTVQQEPVN